METQIWPSRPELLPKVERRGYAASVARHKHDYHQVVLPRAGAMEIDIAGRGGFVNAAQGAFVPGGSVHEFVSSDRSDFIVLDIETSYFTGLRDGLCVLDDFARRTFFPMTPRLQLLVSYAASFGTAPGALPISGAWATLFIEDAALQIVDVGGARSRVVSRACQFIEENLAQPLTISMIARAAGVSERGLHDRFGRELRTKPFAYLTERRIARALDLLEQTGKPIEEVAFLSGYADQSTLTRALRKSRGFTPAAYRRKRAGRS